MEDMESETGFEPVLMVLQTDALDHWATHSDQWYGWPDSNQRPHAPEACALPTELHP